MNEKLLRPIAIAAALILIISASAARAAFTVQNISGAVEYRTSASGAWSKASNGLKLNQGATLRTQKNSTCNLKSDAGNAVKVQQLTTFDISAHSGGAAEKTQLNLSQGKIIASVKKGNAPGSSFNVKTPTAVAGVRGTDFFADVTDNGASSFGVTEGSIGVAPPDGGPETLVDQDFIISVDETGAITEPAPMPEEMKQEMINETKDLKTSTESAAPPAGQSQAQPAASDKQTPAAETSKEQTPAPAAEQPAPAPETNTPDNSATDNIDNTLNNQVINDTAQQAAEEGMKTGTVNIDIYIGN